MMSDDGCLSVHVRCPVCPVSGVLCPVCPVCPVSGVRCVRCPVSAMQRSPYDINGTLAANSQSRNINRNITNVLLRYFERTCIEWYFEVCEFQGHHQVH